MRAQAGAFLVSAFHSRFERQHVLEHNAETPVYAHYEMIVPRQRKNAIREEPAATGCCPGAAFSGLDTAAEAVAAETERAAETAGRRCSVA